MFARLSSRERNLVLALAVIAIGFLFYKYILHEQIVKNAELKEVFAQEEEKLEQSQKIANSLDEVTFAAKNSAKELELVKSKFITKSDDGSSEIKFGKDAKSDSVKILLFQPLPIVNNEDYVELPIRMEIEGKYFPIINFLTSIEGFFNLTEIKDLHIKNDNDSFAWDPNLKASFTFSIYTTNPPEEESSYSDLTQWTVGRLNSFTVGVRALAKWNTEKTDSTSNPGTGTNVNSGQAGETDDDSEDNLPPEGSNDLGVLK